MFFNAPLFDREGHNITFVHIIMNFKTNKIMKKLYSLLMILAMVATFSACSKEDTPDLPKSKDATVTKVQKMSGVVGTTANAPIEFTRSDFSNLKELEKWVKSGNLQSTSFIEMSEVAEGVKFSDVKLTIKDSNPAVELSLGEISGNKVYKGMKELNFLQKVIDEVAGRRGKSTLVLTYKIDSEVSSPAEMKFKLDAEFGF